jgi:hypothetical protein
LAERTNTLKIAREVNTAVALRLQGDAHLADLLHRNPNFEEALTELQNETAISARSDALDRLRELETAIVGVFADMNKNLADATRNFSSTKKFSIVEFLVLFDAIFTLNQGLLLEAQYHHEPNSLSLTENRKWLGCELPGTEVIPDPKRTGLFNPLTIRRRPKSSPATTVIDPQYQPYFKLHGSTNWQDPNGERLLVMGGNKPTTMRCHPILMWYASKFVECLSKPGARLMVIGYGFRDDHINQRIVEAWEKGGRTLSMREILRKVNSTYGKPLYLAGPLEQISVYDSTRPLRTTFGDNDPGEHEILIKYIKGA